MGFSLEHLNWDALKILDYIKQAMKECGFSEKEIEQFESSATDKDYTNFLKVAMKYINLCNDTLEKKFGE